MDTKVEAQEVIDVAHARRKGCLGQARAKHRDKKIGCTA